MAEYEHAIIEFKKAHSLRPEPRVLYLLGRAYELNRDFKSAIEVYEQILSSGTDDPEILAAARKGVEAYKSLFPEEKLKLTVTSNVDRASVQVDGALAGSGASVTVSIDGGKHVIKVLAEGYEPFEQELDVQSEMQVHAQLVKSAAPAAAIVVPNEDPAPAVTQTAPATTEGGGNTGAWIALGAGGVLLATGAVFNVLYMGAIDDATSAADRGDLAGYDSAVSSSDTNQTISLVGYVGGAVGIVAGGVLLWLGSANEAATVVAPAVTADFAGAVWYGRF
jgi:tetratricopeptide (TPR) repeat protein